MQQPASSSPRAQQVGLEDLFKSDQFRMDYMKVVPCTKHYAHDWTECPFAHPHEKARRRDPQRFTYTGIACPSMRQDGSCTLGDNCPYAHNVFEYWLHPTRYRTQLCNDGTRCSRKICFFAHSIEELRTPEAKPFVPAEAVAAAAAATAAGPLSDPLHFLSPAGPQVQSPLQPPAQDLTERSDSSKPPGEDHPLLELMTRLVARGKVSPEKSAAILQQMLSPEALYNLQAQQAQQEGGQQAQEPPRVCSSDPTSWASPAAPAFPQYGAPVPAAAPAMASPRLSADAAVALAAALQPGAAGMDHFGHGHAGSLADARTPLLRGALLPEAHAHAALVMPEGTAATCLSAPAVVAMEQMEQAGSSARSSLDTARLSLDSALPLGPISRPSWDASLSNTVQQQLLLESLLQQQVLLQAAQQMQQAQQAQQQMLQQQAQQQMLQQQAQLQSASMPQAQAADDAYWTVSGPHRVSLDSQISSQLSGHLSGEARPSFEAAHTHASLRGAGRGGTDMRGSFDMRGSMDGGRASMDVARHSMDVRHSMDSVTLQPAPATAASLAQHFSRELSQELARISLDNVAPRVNAFSSGFYTPGDATPARTSDGSDSGAGRQAPPAQADPQPPLLHPQPRRSY